MVAGMEVAEKADRPLCTLLLRLDEPANSAVDGIGPFKLDKMSGDGDDDVVRAGDAARDILVVLAHENGVALPQHHQCGNAQQLQPFVAAPGSHHTIMHPAERALRGKQGNTYAFRDAGE